MAVVGREVELAAVDAWLAGVEGTPTDRDSGCPILVLSGLAGIGKSTLWAEAVARARAKGFGVLACRPGASDVGLCYVGMADLLRPISAAVFDTLPTPQRRPVDVALLRAEPTTGDLDPRAVATGLTAVLDVAAGDRVLLLSVDDAQWLDAASARALSFALRRLRTQRVGFLGAVRTEDTVRTAARGGFAILERELGAGSLTRLPVGPLNLAATHNLIRDRLGATFSRPDLVRIHQAAEGNPFFALEIARDAVANGIPPPGEPLPVPTNQRDRMYAFNVPPPLVRGGPHPRPG
jgi:hypothetical protein